MNIIQLIVDNTNLNEDQICITRSHWDGFNSIYVIKDNKIVCLGEYCYKVPNEAYLEKLKIFVDLCVKKYKGEIEKVPSLCGNSNYWDDCYKD
jgi:hypothetical protein